MSTVTKKPYIAKPYPAGWGLLAACIAIVGVFATIVLTSDAIAMLAPPHDRVQWGTSGHAQPLWALKLFWSQHSTCQHECSAIAQAAVKRIWFYLIGGLLASGFSAMIAALIGSMQRTKTARRRPPIPARNAPVRLALGTPTGYMAEQGHGAGVMKGAPTYMSLADMTLNILLLGAIGSGKTSSALNPIVEQVLAFDSRPGMLIFDMKGDYSRTVRALAARCGRDVVTVGLGGRPCNLLQGLTPEVAAGFLKSVLVLAGAGVGTASVYLNTAVDYARNLLGVLSFTDDYSLTGLATLIYDFRLVTPLVKRVSADVEGTRDAHKIAVFESYENYITKTWNGFDLKIKHAVGVTLSQVLDAFSLPEIKAAFCTASPDAVSMNEVLEGKVLLLDLPLSTYGMSGKTVYTFVKLRFFNTINQRRVHPEWDQDRLVAFVADEYQEIVSVAKGGVDSDLNFWDKSRSGNCVGIISGQSISSFYAAIGDRALTDTLLQNFRQKIVFASEDEATIKYFAYLFGDVDKLSTSKTRSNSYSALGASRGSAVKQDVRAEKLVNPQLFRTLDRSFAICMFTLSGKRYDDIYAMPFVEPTREEIARVDAARSEVPA